MRKLLPPFLICLLLVWTSPLLAGTLMLIESQQGGPYAEFSRALEVALGNTSWRIGERLPADSPTAGKTADLIITTGSEAFRQALRQNPGLPILATLLPRQGFERALNDAGRSRQRVSAIFLDQPAGRQASFLRHLLPGSTQIGMLYSSESRNLYSSMRSIFASNALQLNGTEVGDNDLLPELSNVLSRNDALLAIPDSSIYRRDQIKGILMTSYRLKKPVIAFSQSLVHAGALAGIYSDPAQIARQTADLLISNGANLPPPMAPSQFAISLNPHVADALGIRLPDETELRRAMLADKESR